MCVLSQTKTDSVDVDGEWDDKEKSFELTVRSIECLRI